MTTIAELAVRLTANTSEFTERMNKAKDSLGGLKNVGLAVAGVGAGFAVMTKQVLNTADEIQKMGIRTGASTEFLSEIAHAANLSGSSLQEVGGSITRLNRAVAEAQDGTKQYAEAFEQLGLDVEAFGNLNPDAQFTAFAEAIRKVEDPAGKTQIVMDVLGRSGANLIPLLEGGAAGLEAMRQQSRELNLTIGQDQANAAARANDAMTKMQGAVTGLTRAFVLELVPGIADALVWLADRLPAALTAVRAAFAAAGQVIGGVGAGIGAALSGNFRGAMEIFTSLRSDAGAAAQRVVDEAVERQAQRADDRTPQAQLDEQRRTNDLLERIDSSLDEGLVGVAG